MTSERPQNVGSSYGYVASKTEIPYLISTKIGYRTGVGGTYLFLNVSLLLAEKTFYIYENRKFVENNITPTNSSSLQSILPLPMKQREQKET